jgi:hypothetical protein
VTFSRTSFAGHRISSLFLFCAQLLLVSAPAHAEETPRKGRFIFLERHCEQEDHIEAGITPLSPPFEISDTTTPGCNAWELNFFVKADLVTEENRYEFPVADINYGLADNFQFKFEVSIINAQVNKNFHSAIGNTTVGAKYRFYENHAGGSEFAVFPQFEFETPWSKAYEKEVVEGGTTLKIPVLFSTYLAKLPTGPMMLTINFGYSVSSNDAIRSYISTGAAVGFPVSPKASILVEVATEQAVAPAVDGSRKDLARIDIGTLIALPRDAELFLSLGEAIGSSDSKSHTYVVTGVRLFR